MDYIEICLSSKAIHANSYCTAELVPHLVGGNQKRSKQSMKADQKLLETVFSIDICCQSVDKWQSKILFLTTFDLRSSIVLTFSFAAYPV